MDDDYVWIHDYHLLVLPSMLRKRFHRVRCGLFLHSPFPSSEIFRTFPRREEVLRSLLNADLIGEMCMQMLASVLPEPPNPRRSNAQRRLPRIFQDAERRK